MDRGGGIADVVYERIELHGDSLSELDVTPFWTNESPELDDDPFWGEPETRLQGQALFVSGPSRNGNHLIHSMLDGHPELCSVPGEDSFLPAFFEDIFEDREEAVRRLRSADNVDYILHLTGWGINKWRSLWELGREGGSTDVWSGIQPDGQGYVADYQDTVVPVDYPAYEHRLRDHAGRIRSATTLVEVVWFYMDAVRQLAPHQDDREMQAFPNCWIGSGMRREMAFLFPRTSLIRCVAPIRPFETYYASFAKGRFGTTEVCEEILREAWQHWLHKTVDYLLLKKAYPDRVALVNFNHAIERTESVGREICAFLGVPFNRSLLTPTTLGRATKGNSSFPMGEDVRGTFYASVTEREPLAGEYWPPQYPPLWNIVEKVAL